MQTKEIISPAILTDLQAAWLYNLVHRAMNPTRAAREAGYNQPKQSAHNMTRNPRIMALVRQERQKLYQVDLAPLAASTLRQIMLDSSAPASARVSAARTALELAGDLRKDGGVDLSGLSLAELTADELASMIDRYEEERSALSKDITPTAAALPAPS